MGEGTSDTVTRVCVTVRFFAAARAAVGAEQTTVELDPSTGPGRSVQDLVMVLGHGNPELARVLQRCSFLVDEVAVRDHAKLLPDGATVDVLPPFAGG